jgi:hypothetical protein
LTLWDLLGSPAWGALSSLGTVAAVAVAAWAAHQARASANTLAAVESQRRHSELCPWFKVVCEPANPGSDRLLIRVALFGPSGLDHLDRLAIKVRNGYLRRSYREETASGPSTQEIRQHIWGPYRFVPGTGSDGARADATGREMVNTACLPMGEELRFIFEPTSPAPWMTGTTPEQWRQQQGSVVRLGFTAEHAEYGKWYIPTEIDVATTPVTMHVAWA